MNTCNLTQTPCLALLKQARRASGSSAALKARRFSSGRGGLTRTELRHLRCNAAAEPEIADQKDLEAAVSGKQGNPKDAAGVPITGESGSRPQQQRRGGSGEQRGGGSRQRRAPPKYQVTDLKVDEWYDGSVVNLTPYGAFVDIGAPRPGLLHISQLTEGFTKDAASIVKVGEKLKIRIREVDLGKNQWAGSLLEKAAEPPRRENGIAAGGAPGETRSASGGRGGGPRGRGGRGRGGGRGERVSLPLPDVKVGQKVTGKVIKLERYGLFISLQANTKDVLLPSRDLDDQNRAPKELNYAVDQEITAYVAEIDTSKQTVRLTTLTPEEQEMESRIATKGVQVGSGNSKSSTKSQSLLGAALLRAGLGGSPTQEPEAPVSEPEPEVEPSKPEAVAAEPELKVEAEPAAEPSPAAEPAAIAAELEPKVEAEPVIESPPATEPAEIAAEPEPKVEAEPAAEPSPAAQPTAVATEPEQKAVSQVEAEPAVEPSPATDSAAPAAEPAAASAEPEQVAPQTPVISPEPNTAASSPAPVDDSPTAPAVASDPEPQIPVADAAPAEASEKKTEPPTAPKAALEEEPKAEAPAAAEPAAKLQAADTPPAANAEAPKPAAKKAKASTPSAAGGAISASAVKDLREKTGAGMMDCKNALKEVGGDVQAAIDFLRKKGLAGAEKKAGRSTTEGLIASYIHAGSGLGVLLEVNCETDFVARGDVFKGLCSDMAMQIAAFGEVVAVSADHIPQAVVDKEREIEMGKDDILSKPEDKRAMIVEGRITKTKKRMSLLEQPYIKDNNKNVETFIKETIAQLGENISVRRFERFVLGEGIKKKEADLAKDVEEQTKKMQEAAAAKADAPKEEAPPEPTEEQVKSLKVSAKVVKELRQASGAGMMDCKRALAACEGDMEKAADYLRKKGLASADKKAGRVASEGAVASYIHGGRLGVLVEVNCETDFVARGDVFQTLAADVAMQIASNPQVVAVTKEEFPAEELERERKIAMEMDDLKGKPENIREKIVEGRIGKLAAERALMEQPFVRDPKKTLSQHVKETIAALGENIAVRRFVRFNLGEGLAKKEDNFADEVAKATGGS